MKEVDERHVIRSAVNATEYRLRQYREVLRQIKEITALPYTRADKQILDIIRKFISEEF
jgi:ferritin